MDRYFHAYKIKYNLLNTYMRPIRNTQLIRDINIFINLDDFYHILHRPMANREFQVISNNASKQMTSNIFNLIGHYKNWAIKNGLKPVVYLIYTTASKAFKNSIHMPTYRDHYFNINSSSNGDYYFINQAINGAKDIIPVIAKYLRNVYAIDSKYLEPSAIPYYIAKKYPRDWNLIVSRDEYDMQYCCMDKFSVISPKGDNSTFLTRQTMWNHIIYKEGIKMDHNFYYDPRLFITMKAIAGDRYRGIPRLKRCGWKTIFSYLSELGKFDDSSKEMSLLQESKLGGLIIKKGVDIDALNRNIYCIDVAQQVNAFMDIDEAIITSCLEDMEDFKALSKANGEIFGDYPLNLNMLCRDFINQEKEKSN